MKSFKSFLGESSQNVPASELVPNKEVDTANLSPRSKGERDFSNLHTVQKASHPVAGDAQFGTNAKQETTTTASRTVPAGERDKVKQGTSEVSDQSGFKDSKTGTRRGDKVQGEQAPVKQGSSIVEQIVSQTDTTKLLTVVFEDGTKFTLPPEDIVAVQSTFAKLSEQNQEVFARQLQSPQTFQRVVTFSRLVK